MTEHPTGAESFTVSGLQLKSNRPSVVEHSGQRIALIRVEGVVCAFNTLCPHQLGHLDRGFVHNGEIECPVHGWRFNIRTGGSVYPEEAALRLRRYTVLEDSDCLTISLTPPTT